MPFSHYANISTVMHFVFNLRPRSVLDIGVGMGTYGVLLRQALDVTQKRLNPETWTARIEGVEIFDGYRNPVWDHFYDRIYSQDIRELIGELPQFDMVLCLDVLEHFKKDEARALIEQCVNKAHVLIATTPASEYPQGPFLGNEAESHLCLLNASDFSALAVEKKLGLTNCYICTKDARMSSHIQSASRTCPVGRPDRLSSLYLRAANAARQVLGIKAHHCHSAFEPEH